MRSLGATKRWAIGSFLVLAGLTFLIVNYHEFLFDFQLFGWAERFGLEPDWIFELGGSVFFFALSRVLLVVSLILVALWLAKGRSTRIALWVLVAGIAVEVFGVRWIPSATIGNDAFFGVYLVFIVGGLASGILLLRRPILTFPLNLLFALSLMLFALLFAILAASAVWSWIHGYPFGVLSDKTGEVAFYNPDEIRNITVVTLEYLSALFLIVTGAGVIGRGHSATESATGVA